MNTRIWLRWVVWAGLSLAGGGGAQTAEARWALEWVTIDGGGGALAGGAYQLQLTVGQPDAGMARGGTLDLAMGFWPGPAGAVIAPPPVLSAAPAGEGLVLAWPVDAGPVVLERTPLLGDPSLWQAVPIQPVQSGGMLQVVLPRDGPTAFFRLRTGSNP